MKNEKRPTATKQKTKGSHTTSSKNNGTNTCQLIGVILLGIIVGVGLTVVFSDNLTTSVHEEIFTYFKQIFSKQKSLSEIENELLKLLVLQARNKMKYYEESATFFGQNLPLMTISTQYKNVIHFHFTKFLAVAQQDCIDYLHEFCEHKSLRTLTEFISNSENISTELTSNDLFVLGFIVQRRGDYDESLVFYRKCMNANDDDKEVKMNCWVNTDIVNHMQNATEASEESKMKRWEIYSDFLWLKNDLNNILCENEADLKVILCDDWDYFNEKDFRQFKMIKSFKKLKTTTDESFVSVKNFFPSLAKETYCQPARQFAQVVLKDIYIQDRSGLIYNDCELFMCGHRRILAQSNRHYDNLFDSRKVNRFKNAAFLPYKHSFNFYHFLIEGLPNFLMFLEHVEDYPQDMVYLVAAPSQNGLLFSFEILQLLSTVYTWIPNKIEWYNTKERYEIENLYLVDWYEDFSVVDHVCDPTIHKNFRSAFTPYFPPKVLLQELQARLDDSISDPAPERNLIVYASRGKSPRNDRRLIDEDLLLGPLKIAIGNYNKNTKGKKYKLQIIEGVEPSIEQINAFKRAQVVFGPHGACLSNLLFCQKGTTVIEFPTKETVNQFFQYISGVMELEYWVVPDITTYSSNNYQLKDSNQQLIADLVLFIINKLE